MTTATATPARIRQLQERVERYGRTAQDEEAACEQIRTTLRGFMSVRNNPRARHLKAELRAAERRLSTAKTRRDDAKRALAEAQPQPEPGTDFDPSPVHVVSVTRSGEVALNGVPVGRVVGNRQGGFAAETPAGVRYHQHTYSSKASAVSAFAHAILSPGARYRITGLPSATGGPWTIAEPRKAQPGDALTDGERGELQTALDGWAEIVWDSAENAEHLASLENIVSAARKVGLADTADHWQTRVDELRAEIGA